MESNRGNRGRVSAIIVGDVHATDRQPLCRTDDFKSTQTFKAGWLRETWELYDKPTVIYTGDLFDTWKASPWTISMVLAYFPPGIVVPGNHDLPSHNMGRYRESALCTVETAVQDWIVLADRGWELICYDKGTLPVAIDSMPWGAKEPVKSIITKVDRRILLAHVEITDGSNMPGWERASDFLKRFPEYDLIITGHNHRQFVYGSPNSSNTHPWLVNPGSFTRQSAAETHEPSVYLWYAETNTVERITIPHDPSAVTRDHIESKESVDSMIASFIERVLENAEGDIEEVDFRANVEKALWELGEEERNKIKERITWTLTRES